MFDDQQRDIAAAARKIYEDRLRTTLESSHRDEFVAIEPVSGDHFLGQTLSEAIGAARTRHPDRLAHALRIGHRAAIHFGMQAR